MATNNRVFFQSLESLRGIAALIVVIYHIGWMNPLYEIEFFRNGALMVDLFFVLSGFVMVHCYHKSFNDKKGATWSFLKARFWRLYPLHLVMLFVFLGIEIIKYTAELKFGITSGNAAFSQSNTESFIYHVFLLHSLVLEHGSFNSPSWSISTEFYTYIVFAVVMNLVKKPRFLSPTFLIIAVISLFIIIESGHDSLTFDYKDSIFRCIYGFFIGAFVHGIYFKLSTYTSLKSNRYTPLVLIIFLILFAYVLLIKHDNYIEFLMPPLVGGLILFLTLFPYNIATKALSWSPLLWLGKVSYSIYMVHLAFIWFFSAFAQAVMHIPKKILESGEVIIATSMLEGAVMSFLLLVCVLCASHITYKYIEDPFRKFAKYSPEKIKLSLKNR